MHETWDEWQENDERSQKDGQRENTCSNFFYYLGDEEDISSEYFEESEIHHKV